MKFDVVLDARTPSAPGQRPAAPPARPPAGHRTASPGTGPRTPRRSSATRTAAPGCADPTPNRANLRGDQLRHTGVRHHHTLGPPGRARRVDHVRRVLRRHRHGRVRRGQAGGLVHVHHAAPRRTPRSRVVTTHTGAASADHERDPVGRVVHVDRQVRGTGLQHRQLRHDHVHRPRHRQRHHPLRPGASRDQQVRQPVRTRVHSAYVSSTSSNTTATASGRVGAHCSANSAEERRRCQGLRPRRPTRPGPGRARRRPAGRARRPGGPGSASAARSRRFQPRAGSRPQWTGRSTSVLNSSTPVDPGVPLGQRDRQVELRRARWSPGSR